MLFLCDLLCYVCLWIKQQWTVCLFVFLFLVISLVVFEITNRQPSSASLLLRLPKYLGSHIKPHRAASIHLVKMLNFSWFAMWQVAVSTYCTYNISPANTSVIGQIPIHHPKLSKTDKMAVIHIVLSSALVVCVIQHWDSSSVCFGNVFFLLKYQDRRAMATVLRVLPLPAVWNKAISAPWPNFETCSGWDVSRLHANGPCRMKACSCNSF